MAVWKEVVLSGESPKGQRLGALWRQGEVSIDFPVVTDASLALESRALEASVCISTTTWTPPATAGRQKGTVSKNLDRDTPYSSVKVLMKEILVIRRLDWTLFRAHIKRDKSVGVWKLSYILWATSLYVLVEKMFNWIRVFWLGVQRKYIKTWSLFQ